MRGSTPFVGAACGTLVLMSAHAQPRRPDVFERRFPPASAPPQTPDDSGKPPPLRRGAATACNTLRPEERLACPLRRDNVVDVRPIQDGVLLTLRRRSLAEARLRRILLCQQSLHWARPSVPPPCRFLADGARFDVGRRGGRVTVGITIGEGPIGAGVLRERIEAALAPAEERR